MTALQILVIIIAIVVGVVISVMVLFPLLKGKDVNTEELLDAAKNGINGIYRLADSLKVMIPENAANDKIDTIIGYAEIAVERAEQLYHIGKIEGADRKQEAVDFIYQSLTLAGVDVTDDMKTIVDGCIEAAVYALGHFEEMQSAIGVMKETME